MRDVESLREHYVLMLRYWDLRLQPAFMKARSIIGERRCRVWRLFLCGSAQTFNAGTLNVTKACSLSPTKVAAAS